MSHEEESFTFALCLGTMKNDQKLLLQIVGKKLSVQ